MNFLQIFLYILLGYINLGFILSTVAMLYFNHSENGNKLYKTEIEDELIEKTMKEVFPYTNISLDTLKRIIRFVVFLVISFTWLYLLIIMFLPDSDVEKG